MVSCSWENVAKPQGRRLYCLVVWQARSGGAHLALHNLQAIPSGPMRIRSDRRPASTAAYLVEGGSEVNRKILFGMGYVA